MKRLSLYVALITGIFLYAGAGCSSDPNVEGAKLDLRNKDYDRALENLSTALDVNPDNPDAHLWKGKVLQAKLYEGAQLPIEEHTSYVVEMIEAYNKSMQLNAANEPEASRALINAYLQEFDKGAKAFNRGANNSDLDEFSRSANHFGNTSLIMPDSVGPYLNQAYALIRGERGTDAIVPFERAIELGEDTPDTFFLLASLYEGEDRPDDSVALLQQAGEMFPDNADVQARLLNAYMLAGRMDDAVEQYRREVERDPNNKLYRYNYGTLLIQVGDFDGAIVQLAAAVDLDPDYADAHYNLGAAYVNKAVAVTEEITGLEDERREKKQAGNLSDAQEEEMDAQITSLEEDRTTLFAEAIPSLEYARELTEGEGGDASLICQALYRAYAFTGQTDKSESVSECAGF